MARNLQEEWQLHARHRSLQRPVPPHGMSLDLAAPIAPLPARMTPSRDPAIAPEDGARGPLRLPVQTLPQPDETTCGPTCLHAVYRYWWDDEPLQNVIERMPRLERGGTFAVFLGCDALRKGYRATIYTYNLMVFDPTWFGTPHVDLAAKLRAQSEAKQDYRLQHATAGYLQFLSLGGRLRLTDLSSRLLAGILRRRMPVIAGLSSTFLYRAPREYGDNDAPDDTLGYPAGHFVVLAGYDAARQRVLVVDPYEPNPYGQPHEYWIGVERVIASILLGIVTHDANLLIVRPRPRQAGRPP